MFYAPSDIRLSVPVSITLSFPNKKFKPLMDASKKWQIFAAFPSNIYLENDKGKAENTFPLSSMYHQ